MNNPELADAFRSDEAQMFLKRTLRELEDNFYSLKDLLANGYEKYYNDIAREFMSSYKILESEKSDGEIVITKLKRIFDSKIFALGDVVTFGEGGIGVISRMYVRYEDDDVHIRLGDPKISISWIDLNKLH
jgi:hypothetical protein